MGDSRKVGSCAASVRDQSSASGMTIAQSACSRVGGAPTALKGRRSALAATKRSSTHAARAWGPEGGRLVPASGYDREGIGSADYAIYDPGAASDCQARPQSDTRVPTPESLRARSRRHRC